MSIDHYIDRSTGGYGEQAGFQFEFNCSHCNQKWISPFKPYRTGQISGLLSRLSFFVPRLHTAGRMGGHLSDAREVGAKRDALEAAQEQAAQYFQHCPACHSVCCENCFDTRQQLCPACIRGSSAHEGATEDNSASASVHCPNCQSPHSGGRFCAECGFDLASTHKSCPACSTTVPRSAKFCTDCGHSF